MKELSDWLFGNLKKGFAWLRAKTGWKWETAKFGLRMFVLFGIPFILAFQTDIGWLDAVLRALAFVLPLVDKAWHESEVRGAIVPF